MLQIMNTTVDIHNTCVHACVRACVRACAPHLEHLNEGDSEVEVDQVAKVEGQRHQQAHGEDFGGVEAGGDSPLGIHKLEYLRSPGEGG